MASRLEGLVRKHKGWRVRTIDIEKWGSPVARQYGIGKVPTVWMFRGLELVEDNYKAILAR